MDLAPHGAVSDETTAVARYTLITGAYRLCDLTSIPRPRCLRPPRARSRLPLSVATLQCPPGRYRYEPPTLPVRTARIWVPAVSRREAPAQNVGKDRASPVGRGGCAGRMGSKRRGRLPQRGPPRPLKKKAPPATPANARSPRCTQGRPLGNFGVAEPTGPLLGRSSVGSRRVVVTAGSRSIVSGDPSPWY